VKELDLDFISDYICLFEKVSNLESILIRIMFYYLYEKYDNSISTDLSHFKRLLHKVEDIIFSL
jgi:hypothetical protein